MVIPAGGKGRRFGGPRPKQFLPLGGRPLLVHTVLCFERSPLVGRIVVVVPAEQRDAVERMLRRAHCRKVTAVVEGGAERQDSVWNGIEALEPLPRVVLVHDAVRPMVTGRTIAAVARAALRHGAAAAALPVRDTVKREGPRGFTVETVERAGLWAVQTPQGFRARLLVHAHLAAQAAGAVATDEASLVERLGTAVRLVPGDERNIKVTTPGDLALCAQWLGRRGFAG